MYPNPFKITVNGVEKDIEGYNINEYSYFKLRDIGEQVGFDVDFKEDTIMIETPLSVISENTPSIGADNKTFNYVIIDGIEYIAAKEVDSVVLHTNDTWVFAYTMNPNGGWTDENGSLCYLSKIDNNNKVIEQYTVSCTFINNIPYITKEVFETEVLARIYE